ncbi:MAG: T9SS type A sorting domain-containing protein, partial [Gemmatimonadetes bacterium]|nr:T9SS type A sorting domain-containing protein [Gemmatimonadota bacterium]
DTPSLMGVWDTGPYFHHHAANSLKQTISPTALNPNDLHGVTSILNSDEIDFIVAYVKTIGGYEQLATGVDDASPSRPVSNAMLGRAAPNPFHRSTSIDFSIPNGPADVQIEVYNVAGRKVRTLLNRTMTRGTHIVGWDSQNDAGQDVGNGVYFARLYVNGEEQGSRKMTILR